MTLRLPGFVGPANLHSPSVRRFWDGLAEGHWLHPTCRACGESFFPPRPCCPSCLGLDLRWQETPARGTLHSWTRVHRAGARFITPYVLGLVDLESGLGRLLAPLVEVDESDLEIGMTVQIRPASTEAGPTLYCLTPE